MRPGHIQQIQKAIFRFQAAMHKLDLVRFRVSRLHLHRKMKGSYQICGFVVWTLHRAESRIPTDSSVWFQKKDFSGTGTPFGATQNHLKCFCKEPFAIGFPLQRKGSLSFHWFFECSQFYIQHLPSTISWLSRTVACTMCSEWTPPASFSSVGQRASHY